jgi:hypothetical protein
MKSIGLCTLQAKSLIITHSAITNDGAKLKLKFEVALPVYGGWLFGSPKTDETPFEYAKK